MKNDINVDQLKKIQLEILDVVAEYCKKNKLQYFLAYGTLLGAVRHKGYIPWDDDIDIAMPRDDYNYLVKHFNGNGNYKVIDYQIDKNYPIPNAKVYDNRTILIENVSVKFNIGVNIDIFPIDILSNDYGVAVKQIKKILNLYYIRNMKISIISNNIVWYKKYILMLIKILLKPISINFLLKQIQTIASKYNNCNSEYCGHIVAPYDNREILNKRIFNDAIKLEFEGKEYSAPSGYDEYLKCMYNDYMKFPPVEQRIAHHSFRAYWK